MSLFGDGGAAHTQGEVTDMFDQFKNLDPEQQMLQLEQLVQQGIITPQQAQVYQQDPSSMNSISLDPSLKNAQMGALASLQQIGQGGMTDMDKAQLSQIASDEDTASRGKREAIMQDMQARGAGGSGMDALMRMQADQDSIGRRSARDTDVAGMAQQRALQALQSAGSTAGNIAQQNFNQQAQVASANDAINQFNTQNKNQIGMANTNATNAAQASNLAATQKVADANVALRNQQQAQNKGVNQQIFNNQMQIDQAKAGAMQTQAAGQYQDAQDTKKDIGTLVSTAAMMSDENEKKNIKPFSASEFLDNIVPSKYHYKNSERDGAGMHASPMAQDLEKSAVGKSMVKDTPDGKMVDYGKGFGAILASLVDVHNRVKKIEGK